MAAGTWIVGHSGIDVSGNTIVRYMRPMASTSVATRQDGAWIESRDDAAT